MIERRFFMSEPTTFIKLDRNILRWRWYKNPNTFRLFIHLLLNANVTDRDFENITVCRGQLLTSRRSLSASLGISEQSVRTSLEHLKSTNEITVKGFSKYSIITVNSYDKYQKTPGKSTASPPSANHPPTNVQPQYKNDNKEKNYKNDKNTEASLPAQGLFNNVFLTQRELDSLKSKYPDDYSDKIERLSRYLASTGKFYRNHYAVLLQWLDRDLPKEPKRKASYDIDELEKINILDDIN